jgi:hypothetical protein
MLTFVIVAIDPGHNIGVAYVNLDGQLLEKYLVTIEELGAIEFPKGVTLVVGDGTGSRLVQERLRDRGLPFVLCSEVGTTLRAKELYFDHHPPRGLMRLLPRGLRILPRNVDDFAAYALALRYLKAISKSKDGRFRRA